MSFIQRAQRVTRRAPWSLATRRLVQGLATRLALVAIALAVVAFTGLPAATDALLRQHYYGLRGARASQQQVLLVAADEDTIAAWGPPPWSWSRWEALTRAMAAGKPRAIAIVEARAHVLPPESTPAPASIAQAVAAGTLLLPSPAARGGQPAVVASTPVGGVDAVALANDGPTVTAQLVRRLGGDAGAATLPVDFLGPARQGGGGLPTVPAHRVASGDLPAAAFAGKVLVVGLTAPSFATRVPTPVGPMTPAQVQAQALLALADGASWSVVPGALRWLVALLFAVAALVLVPRFAAAGALAASAGLAALVLIIDYALFAGGTALLGASLPIAAIAVAATVARAHERGELRRRLGGLGRWLRQGGKSSPLRGEPAGDDDAFWQRAAELARLYFDCRSSIVAELPAERWHLRLRVINGVTSDQITERRRDVRRNPYRKAHLTLSPVWHPQFMAPRSGLGTLIVPLVAQARLHGFWLLNFAAEAAPDATRLALVQKLAHELAMSLARRGLRAAAPAPASRLARLLGESRAGDDLAELDRQVRVSHQQREEMTSLGENLPFGVAVATLWGEIRYVNAAMRRLCAEQGLQAAMAHGLPELLAGTTGQAPADVHAALARLVREPQELRFAAEGGAHDLVLTRLDEGVRPAAEPAEQLLLLCALPHAEGAGRSGRASTVTHKRGGLRSLGSSPPAYEEEVTVIRAQLPPPPTAPEPLPAPETAPHPRVDASDIGSGPSIPSLPAAPRAPSPRPLAVPPPLPPGAFGRAPSEFPDVETRVATPPRRR